MADPTKYVPGYSYTGFQGSQPTVPLPAPEVDNDFAQIAAKIGEAVDAIKDVRRSDGALKNGIVTADALAATLRDDIVEGAITDAEAAAAAAAASAVTAGAAATAAGASQTAAAASAAAALAAENSLLKWRGQWLTATAYAPSDIVFQAGSSYVCVIAHTSGTFSTDLTAVRWALFAQQGATGVGTGDLLAAQNLNDLSNKPTARSNLGLGALAVKATVAAADIDANAVTTAKIADGNVTTAKIADANVTTAKIADANVTAAKMASNAVETAKIADAAVTTAKITDANVTAAKLASNAVTTAKVADAAITLAKLATDVTTFIGDSHGWMPYDDTDPVLYDVAVGGAVSAVEAIFEDGYEYLLIADNISGTAVASPAIRLFRASPAAYTAKSNLRSATCYYLEIQFVLPRVSKRAHTGKTFTYAQVDGAIAASFEARVPSTNDLGITHDAATVIDKAEISMSAGNIDAGRILLYRRPAA
jgi:hypothetical protein